MWFSGLPLFARIVAKRVLKRQAEVPSTRKSNTADHTRFRIVTAALDLIRVPSFASVHVDLGLIYEANRQFSKAATEFDTYLRLAPTSPDTALIRYDADKIRESSARNRRLADNKQPSLKRP